MVRTLLVVLLTVVMFSDDCRAAAPNANESRDLAAAARAVFAAKCSECHGADLARPEGRFGYVLDLARVAANPEMVIPSYPDESELWEIVRRGDMPPSDASAGPLSQQEKEIIHSWIRHRRPAPSERAPLSGAKTRRTDEPSDSRPGRRCGGTLPRS